MNADRIEIKIVKDSKSNNAELNAMSLEVLRAFSILTESLKEILENTSNNNDLLVEVKSGSVTIAVLGQEVSQINTEFNKILESESSNKKLVSSWRSIQELFIENGLVYDAAFYSQGQKMPFYETLKTAAKFRTKPKKNRITNTNIIFLTGRLIEVGGKKPNLHVELTTGQTITIACDVKKANQAKAFLYETIYLSGWQNKKDEQCKYEFCDSYFSHHADFYHRQERFIQEFKSTQNEIEALKMIHFECRKYLDEKNYSFLRKFLRLFVHSSTDLNVLNTLLIVTQAFTEHEALKESIKKLTELFEVKLAKLKP
jgi:hypothetical protein